MLGRGKLEQEDQAVSQNDKPHRNGWVPRGNRVSYRNHAPPPPSLSMIQ
jgi:hypothetical protein